MTTLKTKIYAEYKLLLSVFDARLARAERLAMMLALLAHRDYQPIDKDVHRGLKLYIRLRLRKELEMIKAFGL